MRESTKRFALDGSHHRCSPLWAKNSPLECFLNAQTLSGSIPKAESVWKRHQLTTCIKHFGDSCGNRTRVAGVRGRSLNRLTNEPFESRCSLLCPSLVLVHHQGLEPGTPWLRVRCSTNWANGAFLSFQVPWKLNKEEMKEMVLITLRVHLFPFRTQKLSSMVPKILGWWRPGKIGRCQCYMSSRPIGRLLFYICI